jgi:hypothetical protein
MNHGPLPGHSKVNADHDFGLHDFRTIDYLQCSSCWPVKAQFLDNNGRSAFYVVRFLTTTDREWGTNAALHDLRSIISDSMIQQNGSQLISCLVNFGKGFASAACGRAQKQLKYRGWPNLQSSPAKPWANRVLRSVLSYPWIWRVVFCDTCGGLSCWSCPVKTFPIASCRATREQGGEAKLEEQVSKAEPSLR